ncbi:MAG: nucleotidyltransferase family protein [Flavisolibacter sp.]
MQISNRLRPEWQILKLISIGIEANTKNRELIELFQSPEFSWGELIEQAILHRVLPLLAHTILYKLKSSELFIPVKIYQHFEQSLELNIYKTKIYRREAAKIAELLRRNGVIFAGTKGIAYESTLYQANGSRHLGDIDFMIRPADRSKASNILLENGYKQGEYDVATNSVIPHPRETQIAYKLHPDHLLPIAVVTDDLFFKYIKFDVACSFTWHNSGFDVDMNEMLADTNEQQIPGFEAMLPVLNEENAFIFTILHLFKEAWFFEIWDEIQQDVNLMKFRDVITLYNNSVKSSQIPSLQNKIKKYGLTDPFYWVCHHLDNTFGFSLCDSLDLHLAQDPKYLNTAFSNKEKVAIWKGTMDDRLFAKSKKALFE